MEQPSLGAEALPERLQHQQSSTWPQCPPLLVLRVLVMVAELCTEHPESGSRTRQGWCHPAPQNRPLHPPAVATAWPGCGRCWKVPDVTHPPPGQAQTLCRCWSCPGIPSELQLEQQLPKCLPRLSSWPSSPSRTCRCHCHHLHILCHSLKGWLLWEGSWQNQGTPKEIPDFSCAPDVSNSSQHLPGKKKKTVFGSIKAVG